MSWTSPAKGPLWPGGAQQLWRVSVPDLSILQAFSRKDHSRGLLCQLTCLGLGVPGGVMDGNTAMGVAWGRCLPSVRCTHVPPSRQVKIFEEDFQRERSDRERMNEEKEELKQQLEKLQKQLVLSNNQVGSAGCHQHSRSPMSTLGVSEVVIPVSQPPYPSQSRDRKARAVVLLLLVPARASPFTCFFLLPLSWGSDGGSSADILAGHCSNPHPQTQGVRGGLCTNPPLTPSCEPPRTTARGRRRRRRS